VIVDGFDAGRIAADFDGDGHRIGSRILGTAASGNRGSGGLGAPPDAEGKAAYTPASALLRGRLDHLPAQRGAYSVALVLAGTDAAVAALLDGAEACGVGFVASAGARVHRSEAAMVNLVTFALACLFEVFGPRGKGFAASPASTVCGIAPLLAGVARRPACAVCGIAGLLADVACTLACSHDRVLV